MAMSSLDELGLDQLGLDQLGMDQLCLDQLGLDQLGLDQLGLDQLGLDQLGMDQLGSLSAVNSTRTGSGYLHGLLRDILRHPLLVHEGHEPVDELQGAAVDLLARLTLVL